MNIIKAAIDIGTNTSHIVIAEIENEKIKSILYRKRFYTYIAKEGIEEISEKAQDRLYQALAHFEEKLAEYHCSAIKAVGTEALRSANNGLKILEHISNEYGIEIEIISGNKEAELIYSGVRQIVDLTKGIFLIVDIGGGSVEFIITENGQLKSIESIPIGIARLYNAYHNSEPISPQEISDLKSHLDNRCQHIFQQLNNTATLIGSAGTFEALTQSNNDSNQVTALKKADFYKMYNEAILLDMGQREQHTNIPAERAKYIVVAMILIDYFFEQTNVSEIIVSPYALKEGLLADRLFLD